VLPPAAEMLALFKVTGVVSAGVYLVKKAVDLAAEIVKARLLKEQVKHFILIYAPDGSVVKRVSVDAESDN
jgi:hypothetical protein